MAHSSEHQAGNSGTKIPKLDSSTKTILTAVEDYMDAARKVVKRGRFAAEDLIKETTHSIKQRPVQTVALTFGLAFGAGALLGWVASKTRKN